MLSDLIYSVVLQGSLKDIIQGSWDSDIITDLMMQGIYLMNYEHKIGMNFCLVSGWH